MYAQNNSDFLSEMFFMEEAIVIEDPDRVIYTHDRGSMNNILSNTNSYTIGTGCLIKDIIPDDITAVPIEHDNGKWLSAGSIPIITPRTRFLSHCLTGISRVRQLLYFTHFSTAYFAYYRI